MRSLYLPSLDGLRVVAFILVLLHHVAAMPDNAAMAVVHEYGWVGVDLFFVISAFLFFYLLAVEHERTGKVSYRGFYLRRLLRLYPLMIAFPLLSYFLYGATSPLFLPRFVGLALFADNFLAWFNSYNVSANFIGHLWTLSFEFQVYLFIPIAFSAFVAMGKRRFTLLIGAIWGLSMLLRYAFFDAGAPHPLIYVTPFLRPEPILVGILLSIYRPRWHWGFSLAAFAGFGALFLGHPPPWGSSLANIVQYPLSALMFAALLDAAIKARWLIVVLGNRAMAAIGTISFGLYVFHNWAMYLADRMLAANPGWVPADAASPARWWASLSLTLLVSIGMAALSYHVFERPFLMLKRRAGVVDGRARIKALEATAGI